MKVTVFNLPLAIYHDDCVGMARTHYAALVARLAEAEQFIRDNCACGCSGFTMMQGDKEVPYVCPRCELLNRATGSASGVPNGEG